MDGVPCSWSATRTHEAFGGSRPASDTLSRLAKLINRNQRQPSAHPPSCVCPECGKGFPDMTELLHHQEVKHALPKPHQCLSCGKEFSLLSSLQLHKCARDSSPCELCHGEPLHGAPCAACHTGAVDTDRPQDKSPHRQPHLLDSSPYACAPCGRGFSQKQALLYHQQAGCSDPPSPEEDASGLLADSPAVSESCSTPSDFSEYTPRPTPGPSSTRKQCPFCPRLFSSGAGLHCHLRKSHPEKLRRVKVNGKSNDSPDPKPKQYDGPKSKQFSCRSCEMVFRTTSQLYLLRKEKHSREKNDLMEQRPVTTQKRRKNTTYPCQVCGKVFSHHLSRYAHLRHHTKSALALINTENQSLESTAKDSKVSAEKPNELTTSRTEDKPVRAGPGRPKKVSRLEELFGHKLKTNLTDNKVVTAGPGRHSKEEFAEKLKNSLTARGRLNKKVARLEEEGEGPGSCGEVPELEEEADSGEFPCPSCAEVFSIQSELRDHVELHQPSMRRRQCSVCAQEIDTSKGSKRQRQYHCVPCQRGFSALDPFLKHCQEHLRVRVEEDCISESHNQPGNTN